MSAQIIDRTESGFTVQVTIPYSRSMLDFEETLQQRLNAAGVLATQEGLRQFDTDGSPITVGSITPTSKGQIPKDYQTPYGPATVERHVYQSPHAVPPTAPWTVTPGSSSAPPPSSPRWSRANTPNSVRCGSGMTSGQPRPDGLPLPGPGHRRCGGRRGVGQGGRLELPPASDGDGAGDRGVQFGRDLCLMCEDGWRETMVGTISFYDAEGDRQHTIYLAATPENGKATFLGRLEAEVLHARRRIPGCIAWGSPTGRRASGIPGAAYRIAGGGLLGCGILLGKAAAVLYRGQPATRKSWVRRALSRAEHEPGGRGGDLEAIEVAGEARDRGRGSTRTRAAGDHVFREPVEGGSDGLPGPGGAERTDRAVGSPRRLARSSSSNGSAVRG